MQHHSPRAASCARSVGGVQAGAAWRIRHVPARCDQLCEFLRAHCARNFPSSVGSGATGQGLAGQLCEFFGRIGRSELGLGFLRPARKFRPTFLACPPAAPCPRPRVPGAQQKFCAQRARKNSQSWSQRARPRRIRHAAPARSVSSQLCEFLDCTARRIRLGPVAPTNFVNFLRAHCAQNFPSSVAPEVTAQGLAGQLCEFLAALAGPTELGLGFFRPTEKIRPTFLTHPATAPCPRPRVPSAHQKFRAQCTRKNSQSWSQRARPRRIRLGALTRGRRHCARSIGVGSTL